MAASAPSVCFGTCIASLLLRTLDLLVRASFRLLFARQGFQSILPNCPIIYKSTHLQINLLTYLLTYLPNFVPHTSRIAFLQVSTFWLSCWLSCWLSFSPSFWPSFWLSFGLSFGFPIGFAFGFPGDFPFGFLKVVHSCQPKNQFRAVSWCSSF